MLRIVASGLAATTIFTAASAAPAHADGANSQTKPAATTPSKTKAICDTVACALGADSGANADAPIPTMPTGQPLYTCEYAPAPPEERPTPDPHQGEEGQWVVRKCTYGAVNAEGKVLMPLVGQIVWQPPAQPSTAALAQTAYRQLKPPAPTLAFSPSPDKPEIVGMPLWLAVSPGIWNPIKATASAGGASVTATATPVAIVWAMGDGHSVVCHGPGTPYPSAATTRTPLVSPTCGFTYPSAPARGAAFPVTATVQWHVEWSGSGGLSGTFADLRSSTGTQVKVTEVQALVTEVDR